MATHTELLTGTSTGDSVCDNGAGIKAVVIDVDLTAGAAPEGHLLINSGSGVDAAESIGLMYLPAGSVVHGVYVYPEEVSTIDDLDIGITGGDTDGYVDHADLTALLDASHGGTGALLVAGGGMVIADSEISALVNTAGTHTTGVFRVKILVTPPRP